MKVEKKYVKEHTCAADIEAFLSYTKSRHGVSEAERLEGVLMNEIEANGRKPFSDASSAGCVEVAFGSSLGDFRTIRPGNVRRAR